MELDGEPYLVMSSDFLRKQATKPVMRTVLKNLITGNTKEHSFHPSDKMPEVSVDKIKSQFLYKEGDSFSFMDPVSFEQAELTADEVGEQGRFLIEGDEVEILKYKETTIGIELPIKITRQVVEAPPGIKGDSSGGVTKEVVVEGGAKVKTPLFVEEGSSIVIDTRDGSYVERAGK